MRECPFPQPRGGAQGTENGASQPLPRKYAYPDNGLAFEVTKGRQKYDIALTP